MYDHFQSNSESFFYVDRVLCSIFDNMVKIMLGRHPDLILWWREGQRFSQHLQRVHVAHINGSQLVLAHSYDLNGNIKRIN